MRKTETKDKLTDTNTEKYVIGIGASAGGLEEINEREENNRYHRGFIKTVSEPGQGACFIIMFPVVATIEQQEASGPIQLNESGI
jgi:hypothetical protein